MAASNTPDRDLSEAAFHSKYGYMAGWDDARDMVREAMNGQKDERVVAALEDLWRSMVAKRSEKRDAYVDRIDL